MIFPFLTEIPEHNSSLFDCVSSKNEIVVKSNKTELLDYMVTSYLRNERIDSFSFVHGLFESNKAAFSVNQNAVLHFASQLFSNSEPLSNFESNVLNKTFNRLIKVKPTLSGRK